MKMPRHSLTKHLCNNSCGVGILPALEFILSRGLISFSRLDATDPIPPNPPCEGEKRRSYEGEKRRSYEGENRRSYEGENRRSYEL